MVAMRLWNGIIAIEGELTGDGRLIELGAMTWLDEPMPLRYVHQDVGSHGNAVTVGQITSVERLDGGALFARGVLDDSFDDGAHAVHMVEEGHQSGVSIDPDDVVIEYRDRDGNEPTEDTPYEEIVQVLTAGRIRAATLVPIPAFANAKIALDDTETDEDTVEDTSDSEPEMAAAPVAKPMSSAGIAAMARLRTVTAAAPVAPPAAWFEDPGFDGPTKLRIDGDRVYGHLATWGTCHIGWGDRNCIQPPVSHSNYAYFATGTLLTAEGDEVAVGSLTLGTGHASTKLGANAAAAHYDDTGTAVADVVAGEDEHGIWVAGALRPDVTDEEKRVLRASALSGDWRRRSGGLELVAALCVNVPGFPVVESSRNDAGEPATLVATGYVFDDCGEKPDSDGWSDEVIAFTAEAIAATIGRDTATLAAELDSIVHPV